MTASEASGSDSEAIEAVAHDALRGALSEARAMLREVRAAANAAASQHATQAQRAKEGLTDFIHHELHGPLRIMEDDCAKMFAALPDAAPDGLKEQLSMLREQIAQLRALLECVLATTRDRQGWPF